MPILQTLAGKYITWEITTSVIWTVIAIVGIIAALFCFRGRDFYDDTAWFVVGVILISIFIPPFLYNILNNFYCIHFGHFFYIICHFRYFSFNVALSSYIFHSHINYNLYTYPITNIKRLNYLDPQKS